MAVRSGRNLRAKSRSLEPQPNNCDFLHDFWIVGNLARVLAGLKLINIDGLDRRERMTGRKKRPDNSAKTICLLPGIFEYKSAED
jgi:hypothetical protein